MQLCRPECWQVRINLTKTINKGVYGRQCLLAPPISVNGLCLGVREAG